MARASRKQSQKQSRDVGDDLASDALPADLDKLSKLAKVCPSSVSGTPTWHGAGAGRVLGCLAAAAVVVLLLLHTLALLTPPALNPHSTPKQAELQHQLEVRGLDKDGNKEELASRLLDNLIAQVSQWQACAVVWSGASMLRTLSAGWAMILRMTAGSPLVTLIAAL